MNQGSGVIGKWCSISRELGERPDFAFGRIADDGSVIWFDFHHEDHDGAGAFTDLLRKQGYQVSDELPVAKHPRPRGLRMLRTLLFTKSVAGRARVPWKDFDPSAPPPEPRTPYMLLSVEETRALEQAARSAKASLNSLLLHTIDRAVAPLLVDPAATRRWMIPVNVRGADGELSDSANHASFIGCRIKSGAAPADVHAAIRDQLAANAHWKNWWQAKIGLALGRGVARHLLRKRREQMQYWTGGFSNMGDWSPAGGPPDAASWCAAPSARSDAAINAVIIFWRGRLTATLQLHPGIADRERKMKEVLDRWRAILLESASAALQPALAASAV